MADLIDPIEQAWEPARLIPVTGIGGATEQEGRATSALLAVLHIVPSFSKAILRYFRAPAGHVTSFREVSLEDTDGANHRPDGAIVVTRGKTKWVCLVEVKTAGNNLEVDQVNRYLALAKQHKFDALLTISNQLVSSPEYSPVKVAKKSLGSVTLRHLSWLRILTEAVNEYEHHGVDDPEQAWILGQLIDYLGHGRSGAGGFEGMGSSWVTVRDAAKLGTLTSRDPGVREVVQDWQQFTEFLCLGLRQTLGSNIQPVYPRNSSASDRLTEAVQLLGKHQRLEATVKVPDAVGLINVVADLESRLVTTSVRVAAPKEGYPKTRINWLLRQLKDAPDDLRITVSFPRVRTKTSLLISDARAEPAQLLLRGDQKKPPISFDIALVRGMGRKRGKTRGSFVAATRDQVTDFYRDAVQNVQVWAPKAPKLPKAPEPEPTAVEAPEAHTVADSPRRQPWEIRSTDTSQDA